MVPPLRYREDVERLWEAVQDGLITTIGTDNTTLTRAEKQAEESIWKAVPGYPVLATHLPVLIEEGYHKQKISLPKLVGTVTENPARLFGLYPKKGALLPGSDADLVVLDLDQERVVRAEDLPSRSDFSLYEGQALRGWPTTVIKSGRVVYENGKIVTPLRGLGRRLYPD
jgi:dihydropyrimidinase